ncbi:MAG: BatA domain-containing protein [Planctomycetota bacterium]
MTFLNPALALGALLFAVPLVIHLLNRQRHKRRPWAAMEFLLKAYQKQRNRLRNENLLLLLLRCLVPIALALAVARPVLEQAAALLGSGGVVHHVVVVDGSYSMGAAQDGGGSAFDRARNLVGRLLDRCEADAGRSAKVTLVFAGVRPRFLCRGDLDLATVRGHWQQMQRPEDAAGDLGEALTQTAAWLDEAKDPQTRVYVLTDLQARALGAAMPDPARAAGPELTDTARDVVEALQKRPGTKLSWIDVGPFAGARQGGTIDNVQIAELRIAQPAAVLRTPIDFVAVVRNRGQSTANCEVTLDVDGGEPLRKVVTVPAGGEGEADFQVVFREGGRRRVRASLVNDALAADDERFLTVEVRDRLRVLLVDGEAGGDPLLAHRFVWQMLDPDPDALPTFAVTAVDLLALLGGQCTPKDHDVIVLADVERLNERAATALTEALQAGRGLLATFGERTDATSWNLLLHAGGEGPLPFRLGAKVGGTAGSAPARTATLLAPEHPVFREFPEDVYREALQNVPFWRWHEVAKDSLHPDAKVLAQLSDADRTPLLVARPFGDGRAVFLTSTIASEFQPARWNQLNDGMVALPLLFGLVQWLALPAADPFLAEVGAELSCSLPRKPEAIQVLRPERDGRTKAPLAEEPAALPGKRFRLGPLADTTHAGFYVFDYVVESEAGREPASTPFAVNVIADEGDLRYVGHDEARTALGLEAVATGLPADAESTGDGDRSDFGPSLLLATLALVLAEAALARWIAGRRN